MGIESVSHAVKQNWLRWVGHVQWKDDDDDWAQKIMLFEVESRGWHGARWWKGT